MDAKQLRNSILQMAIQGKLVPQDPNDEPASVLLDKIRQEKRQLVKEGVLKKKDLEETPISKDEKQFEIPKSWEWIRLKDILSLKSGISINIRGLNDCSLYPVYGGNGVNGTYNNYNVEAHTIIIGRVGFYCGSIHKTNSKAWVTDNALIVTVNNTLLNLNYLFYSLKWRNVRQTSNSTAQPVVSGKGIYPLVVPLPPLAEQHRIVAKLEEILPLVDEYGKAQEEADKLQAELPDKLRKSILQEAIQGKLVPQDPNDEPANILHDKIRHEKKRLVKEGKLKKKDLEETPVSEDERPFEIPETWEWVHFGDIFSHNNGKQLNRADIQGELYDYITTSNLYWDRFDLKEVRQMLFTEDELKRCTATKGDLLVCEGGDVGRSAIWNYDYDICIQNHIHRVRAYLPLCTRFFLYLLMFNKLFGLIGGKGIGIQGFSAKALHNTIVALPPLAEQHRIVAKIEEVFNKIEKLEA